MTAPTPNLRPTTAIILAAGMGTRLKGLHSNLPKGLLEIGGETLIERSIRLLHSRGIIRILLVTGYNAEAYHHQLAGKFPQFFFVHNPGFATNGSMFSLYLAAPLTDGPALVLESDLLYESRALDLLLASETDDCILASGPTGHGDEVFVYTDPASGNVALLTKSPPPGRPIAGEFTGISRFSTKFLEALCRAYEKHPQFRANRHYDDCISDMSASLPVGLVLAPGLLWTEIDDPAHYEIAVRKILPALQNR